MEAVVTEGTPMVTEGMRADGPAADGVAVRADGTPVVRRRRLRKIAIVGGGPTRKRAPYRDRSWEIWAFSSTRDRYPRINRWFEIHALTDLRQQLASRKPGRRSYRNYMQFMRRLRCPVYMQRSHRFIPSSVPFPRKKLVRMFGRCFTSTAAFMIALAIAEGCDVIGLWGVDPKGKKYNRQRPAIRYLLSLARRRGIRLVFPRGFSMRIPRRAPFPRTRVLYAYDWRSRHAWWRDRVRRRRRRRRR